MAIKIIRETGRFYTKTKSGEAELSYSISRKVMILYHTFVPEKERNNGIAASLAEEAFQFAQKKGLKIRPSCSYIVHFIGQHKELRKYVV